MERSHAVTYTDDADALSDDLVDVVRNIQRRATPQATFERVNSVEVRAYLEAGVDALMEHVRSGSVGRGTWRGVFSHLGKKRIEPAARDRLGRARSSESLWQFEYFWRHQADYHLDLVAYILRPAWYRKMMATLTRRVVDGDLSTLSFGELARAISTEQARLQRSEPMIAVAYVVQTTLTADPFVRELMAERYRVAVDLWADLYTLLLDRYELALRPGYTCQDLAAVLNALADGVILRGTVAEDLTVLSDGRPIFMNTAHLLLSDALSEADEPVDFMDRMPRV